MFKMNFSVLASYRASQRMEYDSPYVNDCASAKEAGICTRVPTLDIHWLAKKFFSIESFFSSLNESHYFHVCVYGKKCQKTNTLQPFLLAGGDSNKVWFYGYLSVHTPLWTTIWILFMPQFFMVAYTHTCKLIFLSMIDSSSTIMLKDPYKWNCTRVFRREWGKYCICISLALNFFKRKPNQAFMEPPRSGVSFYGHSISNPPGINQLN